MSVEEFKKGISASCKDKAYKDFPAAFKFFIDSSFRTIDIDGEQAAVFRQGLCSEDDLRRVALILGSLLTHVEEYFRQ